MSKGPGVDTSVASRVEDAGYDAPLPLETPKELREMPTEQWMEKYGVTLKNRQDFEKRHPNWHNDPESWWFASVGRAGSQAPLWLSEGYHFPELDCPDDSERESQPLHEREEKPLWAERVGLTGGPAPYQSATVYEHRAEYLPSQVSGPATMHGRFQPSFSRIQGQEIPDRTDRPDGRFWLAGVAQGQVTDPYRRGVSGIGRRKPIVLGPRTISAVVDGESHTLGNVYREVAWTHPAVDLAGYSQEHPGYNHVNFRMQTAHDAGVTGEQAMAETFMRVKDLADAMGDGMAQAMERFGGQASASE